MSAVNDSHNKAMDLAERALLARMQGDNDGAATLFEQALELELAAIEKLDEPVEPTYSVLHRSAGTMALHCNQTRLAEKLASRALAHDPPSQIAEELRDLIEQVNSQRRLASRESLLDARLTFAGKPVISNYGIWADFAADAVKGFNTTLKLVTAQFRARLAARGRVPRDSSYKLLITGTVPGSFGFKIEDAGQGPGVVNDATPFEKALTGHYEYFGRDDEG